jgi:anti-anti-sigma regulatory factor
MTHAPSPEPEIALSVVRNCLIASVRSGLDGDWAERTRRAVIHAVPAQGVRGVVFDVSAVRMIDSESFRHLSDTARMIALLERGVLFRFHPRRRGRGGVGATIRLARSDIETHRHICGAESR